MIQIKSFSLYFVWKSNKTLETFCRHRLPNGRLLKIAVWGSDNQIMRCDLYDSENTDLSGEFLPMLAKAEIERGGGGIDVCAGGILSWTS